MANKVKLGERPSDDAPAYEVNAWRAAADAAIERMFRAQDAADEKFILDHGGDVTGLNASYTDPDVVPAHDPFVVNPIAERLNAYQAVMHDARTDGVPEVVATELAEEAADRVTSELEAADPDVAAWVASLCLNTEGFAPPRDLIEDHPLVAAA